MATLDSTHWRDCLQWMALGWHGRHVADDILVEHDHVDWFLGTSDVDGLSRFLSGADLCRDGCTDRYLGVSLAIGGACRHVDLRYLADVSVVYLSDTGHHVVQSRGSVQYHRHPRLCDCASDTLHLSRLDAGT